MSRFQTLLTLVVLSGVAAPLMPANASESSFDELKRAVSASLAPETFTEGALAFGEPEALAEETSCRSDWRTLELPFRQFKQGVVGIGPGARARAILRRCLEPSHYCLTLTTSDELPSLDEWFRSTQPRDLSLTLGKATFFLPNAEPSHITRYDRGPSKTYEIRLRSALTR
ncbi:MAG: hypothetical protein NDJ89_04765 [Oligoflexia bacterium]|nr:hypothetical protein [Oligoflexia bacterium]